MCLASGYASFSSDFHLNHSFFCHYAISRSVQRLAQKEKSLSYQLQPIKVDVVVRCPLKADWDAFEALGHNSSFVIADYDNVLWRKFKVRLDRKSWFEITSNDLAWSFKRDRCLPQDMPAFQFSSTTQSMSFWGFLKPFQALGTIGYLTLTYKVFGIFPIFGLLATLTKSRFRVHTFRG